MSNPNDWYEESQSEEFCLIHGYEYIEYDWRSGFTLCRKCEEEMDYADGEEDR